MADLFTRAEVEYGGAFHSQKGIISQVGGVEIGVLMQNLQLQYSQQVTRIYELGTSGKKTKTYYVAGRSQGQVTAGHIIGPGVTLKAFYEKFSDVCKARDNTIELNLGPNVCQANGGAIGQLKYKCKYCVLIQIGMSVQAQDFVINENSTIMFTGLEFLGS